MNYLDICKKHDVETLYGADLYGADLRGANLCGADLRNADLCSANLYGADLSNANLRGADLCNADLRGANLCRADLRDADLRDADLRDADLRGTDLTVIYGEHYFISICQGVVRAGCQSHTVDNWRSFSKREVAAMDGRYSLKYYPRLLDIIDFYCGKGPRPEWLNGK